ncbi:carboxypeptidase-like regulatory domain-containing protein [Fibrella sp. HMF5335]|uniref:Carboxypeptidase-like regulatory domain-containing protein n=1 Tax=Fibrella rubiginis TaxID=2817060 RepID=A0A939K2F2_9BACT|nr:carboxypeptidase-like regulatory domain-containing protein [Fibrella rubiginis]MBO0938152.1 carboxypeptidase-like regulatory domain-containing protein [Fibrella rubiginis]
MKTVFLLFIAFTAHAQIILKGRVVNAANEQPVPFCSVFLANTTKGTTADENGNFTLTNLPDGRYDLVASSVGFETVAAPIQTKQTAPLLIKMNANATQLAEVQVKANRGPEWLANLEQFTKLFIGTSKNARDCKILNTNALWFEDKPDSLMLVGGAREPLEIENSALGYRIHYVLTQFVYDYGSRYVSYLGYPVFEAMTARSNAQEKRWQKSRRDAFSGSSMHFMRALYAGMTEQQGFVIQRIIERKDSTKTRLTNRVKTDRYLIKDPLPGSFLLDTDSSSAQLARVQFDNLVQVTYRLEKEAPEYRNEHSFQQASTFAPPPQTSIMRLVQPYVLIEANGNYYNPLGIVFEGYWGWEKIADMLPFTYEP